MTRLMFMKPMLATAAERPFDDTAYLFEPIIDGQRLQLAMTGGIARLLTRHGYDVTRQYPELHNVPLRKPADVVLDGEIAYVHPETGEADFSVLQQRYRMKGHVNILEAKSTMPLRYFVFDILYYNGIDLREYPLHIRKRVLLAILENNAYFTQVAYSVGSGIAMLEQSKSFGLEGVIGKARNSKYTEGVSGEWIKMMARPQSRHA